MIICNELKQTSPRPQISHLRRNRKRIISNGHNARCNTVIIKHIYSCAVRTLPYIMILAVITLSQSQKSVCLFLFGGTYDHPCVKQARAGL